MKPIAKVIGFVIASIGVQYLFWRSGLDIFEDFNLFPNLGSWPWLAGATVLFVVLFWLSSRFRTRLAQYGAFFGMLTLLLALGWLIPPFISKDGMAVGILRFLNTYWIAWAGISLLTIRGIPVIWKKVMSKKGGAAHERQPIRSETNPPTSPSEN